tara:strand:+ start:6719 stop:7717 length:999 start_codon:yes stop_codon:yes gene_type:complete
MSYLNLIDLEFFVVSFTILFFNILILNYRHEISKYLKIIDIPNERKIHQNPTPLTGGIGYYLTLTILLFYIFFDNQIRIEKFLSLISIYSIFFFIGLYDDIKTLSAKLRSFLVIISLILLIIFDSEFIIGKLNFKSFNYIYNLNYLSVVFTLFCIFALYNALNFIDGYNGSATSIILFWSIYIFVKNPNLVYLIIILISLLIFWYNLSGKIFLGNSGTSLISIFFALSVINEHNNGLIYADEILLILLFPGLDMIRVTTQRILSKKRVYDPDKTHFHHYLISSNLRYVWQTILMLTISPIILFSFFENLIFILCLSIMIYILIFAYIKKKNS